MIPDRPGRNPIVVLALGLVASSMVAGGWLLLRAGREASAPLRPTRLFEQVLEHIRRYGVDSLANAELFQRAASGLMRELDDEFATIRPAGHRGEWPADIGGLGLLLTARGGRTTVLSVVPGSPTEHAGLRSGDQLVEIAGDVVDGLSRDAVLEALNGEPGSRLALRVRRPGLGPLLEFSLQRGSPAAHVLTEVVDVGRGVRYVGVPLIGGEAAKELRNALRAAAVSEGRGLVLDLRGAAGGDLEDGIALAGLFLPGSAPIVTVRGRDGGDQLRTARTGGDFRDLPLVVLVDGATADAAEVAAGALQDNDRALLVGWPSFGRGVTTEQFEVDSRMVVRFSTARWVTPSGRAIQPDSAAAPSDPIEERPSHRTLAGREVHGGGGIVPDSIVQPPVPGESERAFHAGLGAAVPALAMALGRVARELARSGGVTEGFEPGLPDLGAVRDALAARGVRLTEEAWAAGADYLRRELGNRAVVEALGRPALVRRAVARDGGLGLAVRLLRSATGPADLLGLGAREITARRP